MRLSILEIFKYEDWAGTNLGEGEELLNSECVLKCDRVPSETNDYKIVAYCREPSTETEKPFEIKGDIDENGCIKFFTCSCMVEKCKHIMAVLVFCYRQDDLNTLSTTGNKSKQKNPLKTQSEQTKAVPISQIKCYEGLYRNKDSLSLSDAQKEAIKSMLFNFNVGKNPLTKHMPT